MKLTRYREFSSFSPQDGVRLLAHQSARFKTARARVYFLAPIEQYAATEHSVLAKVLAAGSENHKTRRDIARECEELYGASLGVGVTRFADVQAVVGTIDFPADRFLPKGSKELDGALSLLAEVMTRPALEDGSALRADVVDHEKYQLENELRALKDDKPTWAQLQATRRIYAGTPGAVAEVGEIDDIPAITPAGLLNRHRLLLGNARVMAYVAGAVEPESAIEAMARHLQLPRKRRPALPPALKLENRGRVKRHREDADVEQTHLVFAWSGGAAYGDEGYAPMLFADALFGGYGMSRLFKVVREEHGLAYAVFSAYHRARGAILAQAAVDPARADKAAQLIRSEFKRLQRDGFSKEEFAAVRESLIESRKSSWESLGATIGDATFQSVLSFKQAPDRQLKDIQNVRPEQVRKALKALQPHTEYRLG